MATFEVVYQPLTLYPSPLHKVEEILERGYAPLLLTLPPSLIKGRGQGDRLPINLDI